MNEIYEMAPDASQVLLREAKLAARAFAAAGICSPAGAETAATLEQLTHFEFVLDAIMGDSCDQLRQAILRAFPACPPAAAESSALEFLGAWGQSAAAEGLGLARGEESGLEQLDQDRVRLLTRLLERVARSA